MGYILAIDPGPLNCGAVVIDSETKEVLFSGDSDTADVLKWVRNGIVSTPEIGIAISQVACEDIVSMGLRVGISTFDTCKIIGRMQEAYSNSFGRNAELPLVSRRDVKIVLAGGATYKNPITGARKGVGDTEIKNAVKSRYPETGGGNNPVVGTKKQPGPLFGVSRHSWQALAVALVYCEINNK